MKYVMITRTTGSVTQLIPVIFPETLIHSDVGETMMALVKQQFKTGEFEIVSAGACTLHGATCYGKSETLKLASDPSDSARIRMIDYMQFE